jgi:hypothetical protein
VTYTTNGVYHVAGSGRRRREGKKGTRRRRIVPIIEEETRVRDSTHVKLLNLLREGYMNLEFWETSQHLLLDTGNPRKTCAEVAGCRTFRILTLSQQPGI